ncbi:MAG: hypothetical protein CMN55_03670 [Sneathiella sp.]|nr:hypothetical protein [Sneathiella sp.]
MSRFPRKQVFSRNGDIAPAKFVAETLRRVARRYVIYRDIFLFSPSELRVRALCPGHFCSPFLHGCVWSPFLHKVK